jgi:hypothetical protein
MTGFPVGPGPRLDLSSCFPADPAGVGSVGVRVGTRRTDLGRSGIRGPCSRRRARDEGDRFIDGRDHRQVAVESGHAQDAPYQRRRRGEHHLRPHPRLTVSQVKKHAQTRRSEQPDPGDVEDHVAAGKARTSSRNCGAVKRSISPAIATSVGTGAVRTRTISADTVHLTS